MDTEQRVKNAILAGVTADLRRIGHEVETMTGKVIGFKEWRKDHEKWPHGNPDDPVMEKYRDGP